MNTRQKQSEPEDRPKTRLQEWSWERGVLLSDDAVSLEACFRLRYDYFVERRAWVPENVEVPGIEQDAYDEHCLHLGVWDEQGVAAYLRVLPFDPAVGFMLDRELSCLLRDEERQALPRERAVELSRLVVRPDVIYCKADPHPVDLLLKALYRESRERGYKRFYIVVEQGWLGPFTRRFGLPFQIIGLPHVFPNGTRTVAATATLEELEAGMRCHSASKYDWYQEDE